MHRILIARTAAAAAALTLVATAGIASADRAARGDTRGDNPGGGINRDLKGVTHGHTGKLLKHGISVYGKQIDTDGLNLNISVKGDTTPEFFVTEFGVFNRKTNKRTGKVKVVRPSENKIRYVFGRGAIGKPPSYKWWVTYVDASGTIFDRAPNTGFVTHVL